VGQEEDTSLADNGDTSFEEAKYQRYVKGYLHKTLVPEDKAGKERYVFPSHLHEKQVSLSTYSRYFGCFS
jgi:hypothetical protein